MLKTARRLAAWKTATLALVGGLTGGAIVTKFAAGPSTVPVMVTGVHAQSGALPEGGYTSVVRRVTPAVVNISTTRVSRAPRRSSATRRPALPPGFEDFFGPNFGGPEQQPRERRGQSLGSGVIVSPQGYVITNAHVIEDATEVKVALNDRREFTAKIVGSDPQTDVAVLKLDEPNLPVLPLGDSTRAQVGDFALAVGNPFGIGQTVTFGIIGATGRTGLGIEAYEDFIQTDAAINPGNSGGALVNTQGQLIGINTAILSGGGGNQGVGFAIPINMAREVMDQLIKTGKVTRGYIGASLQDVDAALGRTLGVPARSGVAITEIVPGSPAEKAGLKAYDVITAVNGTAVSELARLRLLISRNAPGTVVQIKLSREGKEQTVPVTLGTFPTERADAGGPGSNPERGGQAAGLEGLEVESLTAPLASQLGLPSGAAGVIVSAVEQNSAAAEAGLRRGDLIEEVNRQRVANERDFERALGTAGSRPVLLRVRRGESISLITVERK